jgi:hypothetical protein
VAQSSLNAAALVWTKLNTLLSATSARKQMDQNKLAKLKSIDYAIEKCCGLCLHGNFREKTHWGTCDVHKYEHLKHSESNRELSIYYFGSCPKVRVVMDELGPWKEFLK